MATAQARVAGICTRKSKTEAPSLAQRYPIMPGHGGPRNQSVRIARELYITDPAGLSLRALSKRMKGKGTSYDNLKDWSIKEGWPKQREKYQETISELTRLKSVPEVAKTLEKILKARLHLVDVAAISVQARMLGGEPMQYGTASTVLMNQGRELIEHFESVGVGAGTQAPEQVLTPEREKQILAIPNPLEDAEKEEDENGD